MANLAQNLVKMGNYSNVVYITTTIPQHNQTNEKETNEEKIW